MACAKLAQLTHGERVARRFGSRAADYDEHAVLQRQTAARLAAFVDERGGLYGAEQADGLVAEVGCGTGLLSTLLAPRAARYLATDIAPEMLERCRSKLTETLPDMEFSVLNGEGTCFAETPAVIVSNLTAQWFRAPASGLAHLAGQTPRLFFAVPLAGSFPEWEQAFADLGRASGLLSLPEESLLREVLCALPDRAAHFQTDEHVIHYADARAFAESFRRIGADTPRPGYTPRPIRAVLQRFGSGMDASARVLYGCITKESA